MAVSRRDRDLKRRYGITHADYEELLRKQHYQCAVCCTPAPVGKNLCVDHCHVDGHIRGLLCHACNTGLGKFADIPEVAARAAAYLLSPPAKR